MWLAFVYFFVIVRLAQENSKLYVAELEVVGGCEYSQMVTALRHRGGFETDPRSAMILLARVEDGESTA